MLPFTKGFCVYYFDPESSPMMHDGRIMLTHFTDGHIRFKVFNISFRKVNRAGTQGRDNCQHTVPTLRYLACYNEIRSCGYS